MPHSIFTRTKRIEVNADANCRSFVYNSMRGVEGKPARRQLAQGTLNLTFTAAMDSLQIRPVTLETNRRTLAKIKSA